MQAIIFDCDGVLADTERDGHLPAFNCTFREVGLPLEWTVEEYAHLVHIGGGKERMATLFDGPLRGTRWDVDRTEQTALLADWHRRKTQHYVDLVASGALPGRPGIRRITEDAATSGCLLAVASTSAEVSVRTVLEHVVGNELASRFSIFAGDIVAAKKPAPDIYLHALKDLEVPASAALVIEDSGIGCQAAIAAGLRVVVTTSIFTGGDDFSGAATVLSSLGDPDLERAITQSSAAGLDWPDVVGFDDLARLFETDARLTGHVTAK
ncbi:MAG: hypothetical protein B5766_13065 [Candidatus Lumbricidophila eiseniae]|uniref:Haloacid dehalogenase n=1 Tax=Candidatus Lumbricidiphila eiseniae TaxID=1969409 RepID=A0A2A6FN34_9MICO|nr:MAG: hypothetical protein B5766_13065 [Candidatus Lumbricidophila eiseniae]